MLVERYERLTRLQGSVLFAALLCGVVLWSLHEQMRGEQTLREYFGPVPVVVEGVITEPVQHSPGRMVMLVDVEAVRSESRVQSVDGLLRLTWRGFESPVFRGDQIQTRTRLRQPFGAKNPGGFDYGAYLIRQGVDAVAMVRGPDAVRVLSPGIERTWSIIGHRLDVWRDQVRQAALSSLEGASLGLFLGMIVGEQSYISQEERDRFMATGTVHILSISGSHLGLLALVTFVLVQWAVRWVPILWVERLSCWVTARQLAALATIPPVLFYTGISGAQVATVRSLLMILLYLLAVWLGHERHLLIALGLSAGVVVLMDPAALHDISFQLSYGSVLAIALALQWWMAKQGKSSEVLSPIRVGLRWLKPYLLISAAVTIATMPLVAYSFNQIAWIGIVSNVLVVPVVGAWLVPLGLISAVGVLIMGGEQLPLSRLLQPSFEALAILIRRLADIPGVEWHVASPAPFAMAGFYAGLLILMLSRRRTLRIVTVLMLMGLTGWWAWSPKNLWDSHRMRVTFLDVGQGDATLLELPDRQTVLIDGGAAYERWNMGRMVISPFLWDQGIRHIDHVIATHPQLDHVGGLALVIDKFSIGHIWDNGMRRDNPFYTDFRHAAQNKNLLHRVAWEGLDLLQASPCRLHSFNPPQGSKMSHPDAIQGEQSLNNQSIVLKLVCGKQSFLFPADVEIPALNRLRHVDAINSARVVKIPHHGAKSSWNRSWIEQLQGNVAVVSAGRGNRYGHPSASVLGTYRKAGFQVYRTDRDGAVWIDADIRTPTFTVHTSRERVFQRVTNTGSILEQEMTNLGKLWTLGFGRL